MLPHFSFSISFLVSLNLSWLIFLDFPHFFLIFWAPEPPQNMENQWKTIGFPRFFAIFISCLRNAKIIQKCFQNDPRKPPRPPQNRPRASQDDPIWPQNVSKRLQNLSKMPQVPPKMAPRPFQEAQNASKSAQEVPKLPQEPPKTLPRPSIMWFLVVLGSFGGDSPVPSSDHLQAIWKQV